MEYFNHKENFVYRHQITVFRGAPVRENLLGIVESGEARRRRWLARMERLGRRGRYIFQ